MTDRLTEQQAAFVRHMVRTGCTPTEAAREAGYAQPEQRAYELVRKPHVAAAIRDERERRVSDLANVALGTLNAVMTDQKAPAAARVAACRTVLELTGDLARGRQVADDSDGRGLSDLTADELTAMAQQLNAALARRGATIQ